MVDPTNPFDPRVAPVTSRTSIAGASPPAVRRAIIATIAALACFAIAAPGWWMTTDPGTASAQPQRPTLREVVGGQPSMGRLNDPRGVAVAPPGTDAIYAVDRGHARVQVFTRAGMPVGIFGERGRGDGRLWRPSDIDVSPDGRHVYVVDSGHRRVLRYRPTPACMAPDGDGDCFSGDWGGRGTGDGLFEAPVGIAVDRAGRVYVADQELHQIQVFDPEGTWLRTFGSPGTEIGELLRPTDVEIGPDGEVWVADHDNHRLVRFTPEGRPTAVFEGSGDQRLHRPAGVAVGSDGSFMVADRDPSGGTPRVRRFAADRSLVWARSLRGNGVARGGGYPVLGVAVLDGLTGVHADPREPQFTLWLVNPDGVGRPFGTRGRGDAHFDQPSDIAWLAGSYVVADTANAAALIMDPVEHQARVTLGGLFQSGMPLNGPTGLAAWQPDGADNEDADPGIRSSARIYIADPERHAVYVADGEGNAVDEWGEGEAARHPGGFSEPHDVAVAPDGDVFVADTLNSRVIRRGSDGDVINVVGETGDGPGELRYPIAVAASGDRVYTLEENQNRLQAFAFDGQPIGTWYGASSPDEALGGPLWSPVSVAADLEYIYILESDGRDHARAAVYHHPQPGRPLTDHRIATFAEGAGVAGDRLWNPRGIAVWDGTIAVADTGNNRLLLYDWGVAETDAPTPEPPTATEAASPTATSSITATATSTITGTATATVTATVAPSSTLAATPTSEAEPSEAATHTATPTFEPSATAEPSSTPEPSATLEATEPAPTDTAVPTQSTPQRNIQPTPSSQRWIFLPVSLRY